MGIAMKAVFQIRKGDRWVDISSRFESSGNVTFHRWLGLDELFLPPGPVLNLGPIATSRGFPDDFEMKDGFHPIASNDIRTPRSRKSHKIMDESPTYVGHFFRLKVHLGDKGESWLLGEEVLNAPTPRLKRPFLMPIKNYQDWNRTALPAECVPVTYKDDGRTDIAEEGGIAADTKFVIVKWDYDLTADAPFSTFIDEIRRLTELHGPVRIVFAFA